MPASQALLDDSENLKHHSINDGIIHSAFMISHFQCESEIMVLYCQAELDRQAFPNRVWERGKPKKSRSPTRGETRNTNTKKGKRLKALRVKNPRVCHQMSIKGILKD
jgi:hypothetical protein